MEHHRGGGGGDGGGGERGFKLFGADIIPYDSTLPRYQHHPQQPPEPQPQQRVQQCNRHAHGVASAANYNSHPDDRHARKKGVTWSMEEHEAFMAGLRAKKGRRLWKEIASEFVKTRTRTQVASHAQKYHQRLLKLRSSLATVNHRRRPSIFDPATNAAATDATDPSLNLTIQEGISSRNTLLEAITVKAPTSIPPQASTSTSSPTPLQASTLASASAPAPSSASPPVLVLVPAPAPAPTTTPSLHS